MSDKFLLLPDHVNDNCNFMKNIIFNKKIRKNVQGYTLVELLVATSVFTVVALGAFTILFAAQNGYDRVSGSRITMDNINLVLDSVSREIKFGSEYKCVNFDGDFTSSTNYDTLRYLYNTSDRCNAFSFIPQGEKDRRIVYYFNTKDSTINQMEYKRNSSTGLFDKNESFGDVALTSTGFKVDSLNFELIGVSPDDYIQPRIILNITGIIDYSIKKNGAVIKTTDFSTQTAITQRLLDN